MKATVLLLVILTSICSFAAKEAGNGDGDEPIAYSCFNKELLDSSLVAEFFNVFSSNVSVQLGIPLGEWTFRGAWGDCFADQRANEYMVSCKAENSDELDLYALKFYSKDSTHFNVEIKDLNHPYGEPIVLPCYEGYYKDVQSK